MASLNYLFFGILILQIYAHAAPSDVSKLEEIAKVDKANDTLDSPHKEIENTGETNETARHKRYFNPFGYGFPPINNFNNRDNLPNFSAFGVEEPLLQIHKHVQEIADFVRQPPPPPIPQVPVFFPILFVPPFDCACNPTNPPPPEPPTANDSNTTPNVTNRFPEMEDERQNWGFVTGNNNLGGSDDEDDEEFSRPISFDPVVIDRPLSRPPPPVDHGTVQSDSGNNESSVSSGSTNSPPSPPPPPRPTTRRPTPPTLPSTQDPFFNAPQFSPTRSPLPATQDPFGKAPQLPPAKRPPPPSGYSPNGPPSLCDSAIITCCHQNPITDKCFTNYGCPIKIYDRPCDPNLISSVIDKFQNIYKNRNG